MKKFEIAIVGAGIVGLAHAWQAAKCGLKVAVFERSPRAEGATVRNFGMLWPIGQPAGERYELALRSRELWLELARSAAVEVEQCGSIHVAHHDDEWQVLEEFAGLGTHNVRLLLSKDVLSIAPIVNPSGLRGGMHSASEMRVDPRTAAGLLAKWLANNHDVTFHFGTVITRAESGKLECSGAHSVEADKVVICSGSELKLLYPRILSNSGLRLCKLQMLSIDNSMSRTMPHIASGLTLRHYSAFQSCPALQQLRMRVANEAPELDRFGIHVMASTFRDKIILGDSHLYDADIVPFESGRVDELILREIQRILSIPNYRILERWSGIYSTHDTWPIFEYSVDDKTHIAIGTGGAGMTLSLALAERTWKRWS